MVEGAGGGALGGDCGAGVMGSEGAIRYAVAVAPLAQVDRATAF